MFCARSVPAEHGLPGSFAGIVGSIGAYTVIDASRGGFAKVDAPLLDFIAQTEQASGVPLEPLYTGKALLALKQQIEASRFKSGTRLIFIHTGGLQGRRGFDGQP